MRSGMISIDVGKKHTQTGKPDDVVVVDIQSEDEVPSLREHLKERKIKCKTPSKMLGSSIRLTGRLDSTRAGSSIHNGYQMTPSIASLHQRRRNTQMMRQNRERYRQQQRLISGSVEANSPHSYFKPTSWMQKTQDVGEFIRQETNSDGQDPFKRDVFTPTSYKSDLFSPV